MSACLPRVLLTDDSELANAIMLMLVFWRGGPVILELNLSWSFIL